ncbi:BTB domain-containing protein [Caenorhabditis elegans]|uniref:BTB domain-containing protein n=1 Tax=Caenorhabditis elegans TaxID=6239 RepID=P91561_CAEEL|nr:BTB domain-containing protein [Caenorhabditis elegans]CCD64944.1 BTB domain-containing protein [Caenorhabditis elegans]|eukprot:NP_494479.2 Uncharacterized protein CELE_ZC239.14 [Caenorhabditis elegans]
MSEIVKLDVGGTIFKTSKSTLTKFNGFFKTMLECDIGLKLDESGCIFIDRSPKHFDLILNFMRDGDVALPNCELKLKELLVEAQFYLLDGLIEMCNSKIMPVEPPKLVGRKFQFIESNAKLLQILADHQKPLLIIGYVHNTDILLRVSLPDNFDARAFIEKYSDQFDIYFKEHVSPALGWTARIVTHYYEQRNVELPPPSIGWGQSASFLERLKKMIKIYNSL